MQTWPMVYACRILPVNTHSARLSLVATTVACSNFPTSRVPRRGRLPHSARRAEIFWDSTPTTKGLARCAVDLPPVRGHNFGGVDELRVVEYVRRERHTFPRGVFRREDPRLVKRWWHD